MAEFGRDYRVLFLDDGSTDETLEVVEPYTRVLPLEILRNDDRAGHGLALSRLIEVAVDRCTYPRRDAVVTMQADFTDDPAAIPPLIKRIEGGADLVVASQVANGEGVPLAMRWVRRGLPWLERKFDFPETISDPISSLRAYRVGLLKRALKQNGGEPLIRHDGWAGSLELLQAVAPLTRRVEETQSEVRYDRRARPSRLTLWKVARDYVKLLRR